MVLISHGLSFRSFGHGLGNLHDTSAVVGPVFDFLVLGDLPVF